MAAKTSQAGSLSATFSEKLKVVGAKTSGDQKELNVAIIKATTSQFHVVPKEKHVRTLKMAVHASRPRRDVLHIITELHRRLQDSTDWLTALKTLITLHRLMRESEPLFMDELVRYSDGLAHTSHGGVGGVSAAPTRLFSTDNFVDRARGEGRFDFSEWVRAYGKYLDEQLTVYATLRWYVEQEVPGAESRMRGLPPRDLLFQLPYLQRLQRRLLDCVPRGIAMHDPVVLFSLSLVVKESFKLYKAVSEGIINLADAFFEMETHNAAHGLEYYKEGMASSDALSGYYATIEQLEEIKRTMHLPKLSTPPLDFLHSMEAYLAEAPRPLPADGEAPLPTKKGVPLRKGRMLSSKLGAPVSAAALAAVGPSDPGMVLPVPAAFDTAAVAHEVISPASPSSAVSRAAAEGSGQAAEGEQDLLVGEADSQPAASQKAVPSALDLLSDLDFSFTAPAAAGSAAALSSNPFADTPLAPAPVAPACSAPLMQPSGSSNPFGESMPSPAGGSAGLDWPAPSAQPPQLQQPAWVVVPLQQPQHQVSYVAPLPSPSAVFNDDPFAGLGAPSPAAAYGGAVTSGGYWASTPTAAPYGAAVSLPASTPPCRVGTFGDELSKAALHDPFAALTGLPPKNSPSGSSGTKLSPPRSGFY